jgi:hypothetical protein
LISGVTLHCSGQSGSGPKLNALNRVRPSKKINFYFFNCVLFEKLEGNPNFILAGSDLVKKNLILIKKIKSRSFNDVAFTKFDPNLNFVLDDILPDVVAHLRNYEKYSPCWIDFVRYEIAHSLMEQ